MLTASGESKNSGKMVNTVIFTALKVVGSRADETLMIMTSTGCKLGQHEPEQQ